jgi:hypothetical protein
MKLSKRILSLAFVGLSVLSLSSCLILDGKGTRVKKDLSYTWNDADYDALLKNMDRFEKAIKGKDDFELVGSWLSVQRTIYACATYRTIEHINYAQGDDAAYDRYMYFYDIVAEASKWQESLYQDMYDSAYKDQFFQGYTEEEIQKLINSKKPDAYYELEKKQEELLKGYRDLTDEEIQDNTADIYLALVKNYKEEAKLLGYDSFIDYAYKDIYEREYTPNEVSTFNGYVKDTVLPLMQNLKALREDKVNALTEEEKNRINSFHTANYNTMIDDIKDYGTFIGDSYKNSLDFILNDGYIRLGGDNANIDGAFTTYLYMDSLDQPIIYFGPSYQNTLTFIHEFGHYNNFKVNGAGAMSYDLAETHSQANELLFLAWLSKNDKSFTQNVVDVLHIDEVLDACRVIILATMVNDFEYRVYHSSDTLSVADFDTYYQEAGDALGGYDTIMDAIYGENKATATAYWKRVVLENPCYYISYAMSKIPSLEIYSYARNDLALARQKYKKTYTLENDLKLTEFLRVLDNAELYSPFDSKAFDLIESLNIIETNS